MKFYIMHNLSVIGKINAIALTALSKLCRHKHSTYVACLLSVYTLYQYAMVYGGRVTIATEVNITGIYHFDIKFDK